jgi:DNA-binding SARP family transcriptional activator
MQQAVLALLAAEPGAVLRRETISDALWGADPPPTSTAMIQTYVSRLRHVLALGRDGLRHHYGSGYQLRAGSAHVDAVAFTQQVQQARTALDAGQTAKACRLYEQALSLWQGEPAAGVDLLRGHPAVTRLDSLWAASVMDYARACAAHRRHDQALPLLRSLTERDPFNERACACLMMTLAACGQQAAALAVYEQMRRRLDDQLGIRPGRELADAHMRVLRNLGQGPLARPGRIAARRARAHSQGQGMTHV